MDFPEHEADILKLALRLAEAMERDPERYRDAPVSAAELRAKVEEIKTATAAMAEAEQRSREVHAAKDAALENVKQVLGENLLYVEVKRGDRSIRLSGLGWGGRPGAIDREPPGQVRDLAAKTLGDASLLLEWWPSDDGGPAAEYRVQRRRVGGPWEYIATAVDNDLVVRDQPRGIEFDLRVVAVNKAGEGEPSEPITVVL